MGHIITFIFILCLLGYIARRAIEVLAALWFYGLLAIGFLSLLVLLAHH